MQVRSNDTYSYESDIKIKTLHVIIKEVKLFSLKIIIKGESDL